MIYSTKWCFQPCFSSWYSQNCNRKHVGILRIICCEDTIFYWNFKVFRMELSLQKVRKAVLLYGTRLDTSAVSLGFRRLYSTPHLRFSSAFPKISLTICMLFSSSTCKSWSIIHYFWKIQTIFFINSVYSKRGSSSLQIRVVLEQFAMCWHSWSYESQGKMRGEITLKNHAICVKSARNLLHFATQLDADSNVISVRWQSEVIKMETSKP